VGNWHLRSRHNQTIWGTGNPVLIIRSVHRPGDNLYTNSAISRDGHRENELVLPVRPGMWDYDEAGTHIMIDGNVAGQNASSSPIRRATASCIRTAQQWPAC
jgi:hypothetical protein